MEKSVNIVAIGDPHLRVKYIKVVDEFIKQTIEFITAKQPDIIIILGDTLHDHESTREAAHTRACNWFIALSKIAHTIVLIGNHDRPSNSHFLTDSHFFNGMKNVPNLVIVDKAYSFEVAKGEYAHRFVCIPYVPKGRFAEALSTLKVPISAKPPTAIFAHQEFRGSKMGSIVSTDGDEWPLDYPPVISGHLHEYQVPQQNVIYVGTPYQTTYAEDTNKGIYMFSFAPNQKGLPQPVRTRLRLRVKRSVEIHPKQLADYANPDTNVDLRIIIKGPQAEVESCKQSRVYKELLALPHVQIVLRPILDIRPSNIQREQRSFMDTFYSEVSQDESLRNLFTEILGDIQ